MIMEGLRASISLETSNVWKMENLENSLGRTRLDQRVGFVDVSHCFYRQRQCCMSPIKTMVGLQGAGFSRQMSEGAFGMQTNN